MGNGQDIHILNAIRIVPKLAASCATANPVEVVVAQTEQGRAILGVVDGFSPKGIEGEQDIAKRNPSCGLSGVSFEKAEGGRLKTEGRRALKMR